MPGWMTNAERLLLGFIVAAFVAAGTAIPSFMPAALYSVAAIALLVLSSGRPPRMRG